MSAFVSRWTNKAQQRQSSPFPLLPHTSLRPRTVLLSTTSYHYPVKTVCNSCESPILLFQLKIRHVSASPLSCMIGGVRCLKKSPFLPNNFVDISDSVGHDVAIATVQFTHASDLFDLYLTQDP